MKKFKNIILIVSLIAALVLIKLFLIGGNTPSSVQPSGKEQIVSVNVVVVKSQMLENKLFASGTIIANEEVELKPETSGKIVQLSIKEGAHVNKGELLVKINDADLQAQLKKIELELKLATEKEDRQKKLLSVGGTSQEEYDAAINNSSTLKADLELTKAQIMKSEILAPFSGTIGLKYVSEGSYVSPTIKIASIQQIDPVKIDFSVPEKYSSLLVKGDSIHFTIQGSEQVFNGVVYAIEPKIDLNTRTLQLRAICQNKKGIIFPGSFAKIELLLKTENKSLLIPTEALVPELKGQKVYLCKNGKAFSQKVETGLRTDTQIEITSGISEGDSLITSGLMQVKSDSKIKIIRN